MRDHVRLRCWPLEASSPPRAGRASCGRRGIVWRSRPLAAAGRSGRHGRACQAAVVKPVHRRSPREQQTAPGLSFGLNSPPSGIVHRRPPGSCSRSSRTVADAGEHRPTLLESVLGATPQEFEPPILRHADLRRRARMMFARCATSRACVSFSVSVEPPAICRIPDNPVYWHAEMTHVVPGQRRRGHTWTEGCTPLERARPTLQARSGRTMITNPSYRDRRLRLARLGDPRGHQRIPPSTVPPVPATMERLTHELAMHQLGNGHD